MSNPEAVIRCDGLVAGYGRETVLESINLSVDAGDFLGVIGPNGGGKTTLMKVILGLVPVRQGSVLVRGEAPRRGRSCIGYVPQSGGHDRQFPVTAWEVASMGRLHGGRLFRRFTSRDSEIIADSLERTGVFHLRNRSMGELSMGQRQRVLFARALAVDPAILLLDEPTASMDPGAAASVHELLKKLNETVTIVMTSHDLTAVFSAVKSIACLNRTLHHHGVEKLTTEAIRETYRCPVDLITHGEVPHRVLPLHREPGE